MEWSQRLLNILNSQWKLTESEESALLSRWTKKYSLKRNDFLVQVGQVENHLFFVLDGTMRIYYPVKEEEVCVGFAYENNMICSYPSFIRQQPSAYAIQALTQTNLMAITRSDFYDLVHSHIGIERSWRIIQEEALVGKIDREVELLTFTPEERYLRLLKRSPHIFQLIPRKYIASYLRMTPETLSRIRPGES